MKCNHLKGRHIKKKMPVKWPSRASFHAWVLFEMPQNWKMYHGEQTRRIRSLCVVYRAITSLGHIGIAQSAVIHGYRLVLNVRD